ncbi:alpha/beta hydrolase family protein [Streptomyces acidiscabies]|nr:alpha/beta hydrolase family protein [Streptomyces acidiscabies]GAV37303.1 alpha/beta hydrolase family protein [Streptomyces acidiscabies]
MAPVSPSRHLLHKHFGQLTYLERVADTGRITMFFHGLGLDATDYQEYLETHDTHGIAVSLAGYTPGDTGRLPPVSAGRQVEMVAGLIDEIGSENPGKQIDLVGFSLGADLVLQLAERWTADPRRPRPRIFGAFLLDPNVNHSTMTISRLFAAADQRDPAPALKQLLGLARNHDVRRSLREYADKISSKDFSQIQQLANDMIHYWNPAGYEQFGARVARVADIAKSVSIVLSAEYEEHLVRMRDAVRRKSSRSDGVVFNITDLDHFGLIENDFLSRELKTIG